MTSFGPELRFRFFLYYHKANMASIPLSHWILAARPKTLPAAVAPVIIGSSCAYADSGFSFLPAMAAMIGALLLQIGVNLANDYFDFKRGIDTVDRLGPARVTQQGLIPPHTVKNAMILVLLLSVLVGLYLIARGGWPLIIIGIASILSALSYSGGPWPLASHGLGDLFVFVFFGPVAVCGTYYVQVLNLSLGPFLYAVSMGFLITAILVVNNLRDIHTDKKSGKNTLAVRLGQRGSVVEYHLLVIGAFTVPMAMVAAKMASAWVLLVAVSLPTAIGQMRAVHGKRGADLNPVLAGTAKVALWFGILLSIGLILS